MRQPRPKPEAISLDRKLQPEPLPTLAKNPAGGTLDQESEPSYHHVGALPELADTHGLPATEPPVEALVQDEEAAMQAVQEGRAGSPSDAALSPPMNVPFGGEGPAERFDV